MFADPLNSFGAGTTNKAISALIAPTKMEAREMTFEEIKGFGETHNWKKGDVVEGTLKELREDVGPNKSTVYVIDDKQYWGTSALDVLMDRVPIGKKVRITCSDDDFKFPNGRRGRNFKVEVDK